MTETTKKLLLANYHAHQHTLRCLERQIQEHLAEAESKKADTEKPKSAIAEIIQDFPEIEAIIEEQDRIQAQAVANIRAQMAQ